MAMQQTGMPPKTKRSGRFPHSFRKFVVILMIVLILIAATIAVLGAIFSWGSISTVIAILLGAADVIIGVREFWSSSISDEAPALASPSPPSESPQNVINVYAYPPDNHQSSSTSVANTADASQPTFVGNVQQGTNSQASHHLPSPRGSDAHVPVAPSTGKREAKLRLTGRERSELRDVLFNAYPEQVDFDNMLQVNFNKPLNAFVNINQDYENILFGLISKTQARGWTEDLIRAAHESNPGNERLENFYLKYVKNRKAQTKFEPDGEAGQLIPENLDEYDNNADAAIQGTEEQLPNTRRGCIVEAQAHVKMAYDLLNPDLNVLPENIVNAVQNLETAKRDIEQLKVLLQADPPPKYGRISTEVDIVIDQIDNYLVPSLQPTASPNRNAQNKFKTLLEALDTLDTLIPQ